MVDLENGVFMEQVEDLVERKRWPDLRDMLCLLEPADISAILSELPEDRLPLLYRLLPKELAAEVFVEMEPEEQELLIKSFSDTELKEVLEELYVDDTVDIIEEMPASVVKRILQHADPETRKSVNEILKYPEDSAGSIMTTEFVDLKRDMTVEDAFKRIRRTGVDKETINICYVTDTSRHLLGLVSIRTLLLADEEDIIEDIMETNVIFATTLEDKEDVAQQLSKYDFLAMPVVDKESRLVGIVTIDDAIDVMEEEATEDFEKMAAMAPSERPYLKTGVFTLARHRIVWLLVLMISGMITGGILGRYEAAFSAMPLLVTFIPMLTDTGGNAGSQSSTLVIRGMAVGEIRLRDFARVFWKELRVSMLVGAALSTVNYVRLILTYPGQTATALTVAAALFVTVLLAKTVGGVLPMAAKFFKADPAIMAAPLITTIVDAISLVVYFNIASALLPLA